MACRICVVAVVLVMASCGRTGDLNLDVGFKDWYQQAPKLEAVQSIDVDTKRMDLVVDGIKLRELLPILAERGGVSIACAEELDDKPVVINARDIPVHELISAIARRLGESAVKVGEVWYIGTFESHDRATLVTTCQRMTQANIVTAIGTVVSKSGKVFVSRDGLVVVGDRSDVIMRVANLLTRINKVPVGTWVVQMHIVALTNKLSKEVGLDADITGAAAASIAAENGDKWRMASPARSSQLMGAISAILRLGTENTDAALVAAPLFLLVSDTAAHFRDRDRIPIPKRVVSDQGTVTTVGYDFIDVGLLVDVHLRSMGTGAELRTNIDLTQAVGAVDGAPIVTGTSFNQVTYMESGGVYLVGAFSRSSERHSNNGPLIPTVRTDESDKSNFTVWARTYRIAAPPERRGGGVATPETRKEGGSNADE